MSKKLRILIIEEDPDGIDLTVLHLQEHFHAELLWATSVQAATEKVRSEKLDLLIVDVRIPFTEDGELRDFGGVDVVDELHREGKGALNAEVPYIFLTAQKRSLVGGDGRGSDVVEDPRCLGVVKLSLIHI